MSDPGSREPKTRRPAFGLPEILDIEIRRVPFAAPKRRNFESALARYKEAIEFTVRTDRPIPTRALGPVLYVGDTPVTECAPVETNTYRFLAFEPKALKRGAPITLGWSGERAEERRLTKFRYERADGNRGGGERRRGD